MKPQYILMEERYHSETKISNKKKEYRWGTRFIIVAVA